MYPSLIPQCNMVRKLCAQVDHDPQYEALEQSRATGEGFTVLHTLYEAHTQGRATGEGGYRLYRLCMMISNKVEPHGKANTHSV